MGILSSLFGNKAYEGLFKLEIDAKDNNAAIFNMKTGRIVEHFYTRKSGGPMCPGHVTWSDTPISASFKWMAANGKHVLTVNELKSEDVYPSQVFCDSEEKALDLLYDYAYRSCRYIFMLYR